MNKRMITFLMSGVVLSTSIIPVQLWAATSEGYYAQASKVEVTEDVTEIDEMSVSEDMVYQEAQDVQAIETRTPSYDEIFKVKNIKSYSNNGGKYGSSSLDKAFDGNTATHWETGKPNSSTHTNEVIVTFDEIETINRITYMVRQDNGFKGFPNEFSIYTSLEETGDNFKIVKTGKMNTTKNKVDIQFNPIQVKRLKFVFNKADQNWASAAELNFYKEDVLAKKINDIFTDGLMMTLKPEYNSLEAIARLEQEVSNHPLKDELSKVLETAKQAINGEIVTENRLFTPNQYGDTHAKARNQLLMKRFGTDLETTGLLAVPGEEIRVYVEAEDGVPLPVISFTQHEGHYNHWKTDYQLKKGMNVFIVPEIFSDSWAVKTIKGGPIYIQNKFTQEQQGKAPQVRIEGGQAFPVFNSGDDQEGFLQELRDFKVKRDANPNGLPSVFEYNTERIMFTGSFDAAYKVFVQEGQDVQESVNVWQNKVQEAFDFAGIDSSDSVHNGDHVRTPIRLMQPYGAAYAASSHIGVQRGVQENFLRPSQMNSIIFGTMHEVGHQMDIPQREWQEVTNNMWSNNAGIQTGKGDRTNYNELFPLMTGENTKVTNYDNLSLSARLGLFWQLELEYPGYWTALERLYREKNPQTPNYQAKVDTLATYSSEVIGADLTEFYDRYAFPISESCRENLKQFPDTGKKYWYMWTNAYRYTGTGFDDQVEIKISNIVTTAQGNKIQMEIDEVNKDDLMGYEIYRDNELLEFAKESSFIDKTAEPNTNYTYEVVAVDKKLNMTERASRKVFTPSLITQPQITVKVNSNFNPLDFANALNYRGEDISKQVRVIRNNVDMTQKGDYEVVYEVIDNDGVMTNSSKVSVVGDYDYVSDINWESAKVGWRTANKDQSPNGTTIQLLNKGIDRAYEKGLGVHANSEVIYNIEGMDYASFEAYIGIDQSMRGSKSSATFEVWLDDEKAYESGIFKHDTQQEFIQIPVEGVKQIKLITTDAKNNNEADHTVWADAKFIKLDKQEIDKSGLQALVDQIADLDETIYTVESWAVLSEKLTRAEEILISEHPEVTQEQVNEIARELEEAIDNLEEKVIESEMKSELRQLLAEADRIAYTNQEQTRWNNFVYIRNLAHSILNNPIATDRDYREAMMHLSASMKDLGYKEVDKSKLQALLNEVLALDEEVYTVESWAVLMNQVTIGKNVVASVGTTNTQEHVDKIARELQQAIDALEEKNNTPEVEIPQSPYYKQLENLISKAATYNKEEYTYETWRNLERAVQYGEATLAKETATEAEFEIAIDLLEESITGLVEVSEEDVSER